MKKEDVLNAWTQVKDGFSNTLHLESVPSETLEMMGVKNINEYLFTGDDLYLAPELIYPRNRQCAIKLASMLNVVMSDVLGELVREETITDAEAKTFAHEKAGTILRPFIDLLKKD